MLLTTARLRLRELTAEDAEFVLALLNEPSFIEHIGDRGVRTLADAQRYVAGGPWTRADAPGGGLNLVQLIDSGDPIGVCGLLKREWLPQPDIGFAFRPAYWSKGYAFEAATAVSAFARDALRLRQLLAIVNPSNRQSIRLLEKLSFTFDRIVRSSEAAPDVAVYALHFDRMSPP